MLDLFRPTVRADADPERPTAFDSSFP